MKGHICRRGKKYYLVVSLGREHNGKLKQKWYSGFDTYEQAGAFREFIQPSLQSYKSLGGFLQRWLENKKLQVRDGTYRSYAWLLNRHVIPSIGSIKLKNLSPMHIQTLYTKLRNEGLSSQSVLHTHRILHAALKSAVRYHLVDENVADLVDPPRAERANIHWWDADTLSRFLESSKDSRYYICYVLLAFTGMRLGEATGLNWSDIDFDKGVLRVIRSNSYTGHGYKFEQPKSVSGRRAIALSPYTLECLRKHSEYIDGLRLNAGSKWIENDLIVTTIIGTPVNHSNIRTDFYRICKEHDLQRIRLHDYKVIRPKT